MLRDRLDAFETARALVGPIVEQHGLEKFSVGGKAFVSAGDVTTAVDQHVGQILLVAEWLLGED